MTSYIGSNFLSFISFIISNLWSVSSFPFHLSTQTKTWRAAQKEEGTKSVGGSVSRIPLGIISRISKSVFLQSTCGGSVSCHCLLRETRQTDSLLTGDPGYPLGSNLFHARFWGFFVDKYIFNASCKLEYWKVKTKLLILIFFI